MWIFFPDSFVSIVAFHGDPHGLLVRGRLKGDIERIFPRAKVRETPDGDYRYRARVTRRQVAKALELHAMTMDYTNVKAACPKGETLRHNAMLNVWASMFEAQQSAAYPRWQDSASAGDYRSPGLDIL